MNTDTLRTILEEQGVDQTKIDEIIVSLPENNEETNKNFSSLSSVVDSLEAQYASTPKEDWKKRASIRAKIISMSIDI